MFNKNKCHKVTHMKKQKLQIKNMKHKANIQFEVRDTDLLQPHQGKEDALSYQLECKKKKKSLGKNGNLHCCLNEYMYKLQS